MSVKKIQNEQTTSLTGTEAVMYIRSRLRMHEVLGIDEYPHNEDLKRFFEATDKRTGSSAVSAPPRSDTNANKGVDLSLLREEMSSCTLCYLAEKKQGTVTGSGDKNCRLMVIGDWSEQKGDEWKNSTQFGPEEDDMLWKMMAAINLVPEQVYVTNCLKCCPAVGITPDAHSEKSCFSYLEREIWTVQPDIICTMGEVAARIITGSNEPLTRLRGKFVRYRYESGKKIDVIPTFHPRFLLQFADMKKATWLDLQAVRRRLDEK